MALVTGYVITEDTTRRTWRVYRVEDGVKVEEYGASWIAQNKKRSYADAMQLLRRVQAGTFGVGKRVKQARARRPKLAPTSPYWRGRGGHPAAPDETPDG